MYLFVYFNLNETADGLTATVEDGTSFLKVDLFDSQDYWLSVYEKSNRNGAD